MIVMVIINASLGLVFKMPSIFSCIYDLINLIKFFKWYENKYDHTEYLFDFMFKVIEICSYNRECRSIDQLAKFLYLLSFAMLFFIYFSFDKKFKHAFKNLFSSKKTQN